MRVTRRQQQHTAMSGPTRIAASKTKSKSRKRRVVVTGSGTRHLDTKSLPIPFCESVWFKTPEQLEVYSRGYQKHYDDGTLAWFILYQPFPQANKISLLVHDGSIHAKQDMFDNLAQLLVKKGNIMEASGAPAHILTQRYRLLPMQNQSDIEFALDVAAKEYKILMNPAYTPFATTDKLKSFVYTRLSGGYANRESLFGRICNNLKQQWRNAYQTNHKCDRECLYEDDDM